MDRIGAFMHGKMPLELWVCAFLFAFALLAGALLGLVAILLAGAMFVVTGLATFWTPKKKTKEMPKETPKET